MCDLRTASTAPTALFLLLMTTTAVAAQGRADRVDEFVERAMEVGSVPGLGLAIVRVGEPARVRGYGLRDLEADLPVTPNTAFYIASSTKSFTALATALLSHRGVLDLDAPVGRYLPELELPAPRTADRVTLRQLLTHRSGLEHDGIVVRTAYTGVHDPDLIIRLLSRAETGEPAFAYTNLGYVITSLVLSRVGDAPWQDVLAREVFDPLGFQRTTAYVSEARDWEVARPYATEVNGWVQRPMKVDATMHAAGGMLTSAADAARWLRVQLEGGQLDGRRVFPADVIAETHRGQAPLDRQFFRYQRHGYGLGWYRALYEGDTLIHHFGSYTGFRSHISFMPEHGLGVAAFINSGSPDAFFVPDIVASYVYDLYLGEEGLDGEAEQILGMLRERVERFHAAIREDRERRAARPEMPPHPLELYTGKYRNPDFGTLTIRIDDGRLLAEMGEIHSRLEVYQDDDLRIERVPGSGQVMEFEITPGEPAGWFVVDGVRFERVL